MLNVKRKRYTFSLMRNFEGDIDISWLICQRPCVGNTKLTSNFDIYHFIQPIRNSHNAIVIEWSVCVASERHL